MSDERERDVEPLVDLGAASHCVALLHLAEFSEAARVLYCHYVESCASLPDASSQ